MNGLFDLLGTLVSFYSFVVLARILLTWVPNLDPYHPAVRLLHQVTEPVLEPARKLIPPIGMMDISPVVVTIALSFLADVLHRMA
jgi:YggT family protein